MQAARAAAYCSRAVYKLEEIERTDKIVCPSDRPKSGIIVYWGAAPRGWSQYVARLLKSQGDPSVRIVESGILPMDAIT